MTACSRFCGGYACVAPVGGPLLSEAADIGVRSNAFVTEVFRFRPSWKVLIYTCHVPFLLGGHLLKRKLEQKVTIYLFRAMASIWWQLPS